VNFTSIFMSVLSLATWLLEPWQVPKTPTLIGCSFLMNPRKLLHFLCLRRDQQSLRL